MLVPTTVVALYILLGVSLLCWGSWISTLKATKKWRFELFSYDFTLGVAVASVAAAFTLGMWNPRDLTFQDNFLLAGYRKMAWCLGSGVVFNLANLLLMAGTTTSATAIAFPIAFSLAWAVGAIWLFAVRTDVNGMLTVSGSALMVIACVLAALAYFWHHEAEEHKKFKALRADPRIKKTGPPAKNPARGIVLSAIGGLIMGVFYPAITEGTAGDNGVSAYGAVLLMATGVFGSTILFVPFFLNFPVEGEPLMVRAYFKGSKGRHGLGLLGGMLWTAAVLAGLVAGEAESARVSPAVAYAFTHGGPVLAALLGLTVWRELPGSTMRVKMMLAAMLVLFLAGLLLLALAPVFGT